MMRGINHQNIFEDTEDYYQFVNTLDRMRVRYDDEGNPCWSNCTYYADMTYFVTLLRYIHQNPVKAGIVEHVKDYEYSSWGEYDGTVEPVFQLCDTGTVLRRVPFDDLEAMVNEPLSDEVNCLDMDDPSRSRPSDDQVWAYIKDKTGVTNSSAFQRLNDDIRRAVLKNLKEIGASHRQLARLTGIGRGGVIQKL
jgi:hypothetical protein